MELSKVRLPLCILFLAFMPNVSIAEDVGVMSPGANDSLSNAISIVDGHINVLDSIRTGEVTIDEEISLDTWREGYQGRYVSAVYRHRLVFDRDKDCYFYVRQGDVEKGLVAIDGMPQGEKRNHQFATVINGAEGFCLSRKMNRDLNKVRFTEPLKLLGSNYVPIPWAIFTQPEISDSMAPDSASREKISTQSAVRGKAIHLPATNLVRVVLGYDGLNNQVSEATYTFDQTQGVIIEKSVWARMDVKGRLAKAVGPTVSCTWDDETLDRIVPKDLLSNETVIEIRDGQWDRYPKTRFYTFHWDSINQPIDPANFERTVLDDYLKLKDLVALPESLNE